MTDEPSIALIGYASTMLIRQERPTDHIGIAEITEEAFAVAEHRDGTEAEIISPPGTFRSRS